MLGAVRGLIKVHARPVSGFRHVIGRQYEARPLRTAAAALLNAPTTKIQLRDYQEECIEAVLSYLRDGHQRLGISLATGSGKTVIFTELIDRILPRNDRATQTLVLAHRRELVEQAARHCAAAYPSKVVDIEMGSSHASGIADITIASVPSIISGDRLQKFDPSRFKLVLVDEAHHIVANSFMKSLRHFGLTTDLLTDRSPALVGVSATMSRFDGLRLSDAIDHIVYHKDYIDMVENRWLTNVIFTTVQSRADISKVRSSATGDFQTRDLSNAVNTSQTNEVTVQAWLARAAGRKSTLVFCVDLAHVAGLTAAFRARGIDAKFVTGDTPKMLRSERLDSFKAGEYPVLLNCGVFTEGTDIPNIDCVLLARPTKSRNLLVQMIGRGMRLQAGKSNCHIIDMVSSLESGVVTVPTLFGLDPKTLVNETTVEDMKSQKERAELEAKREQKTSGPMQAAELSHDPAVGRTLKFTDYESVYDLIDDTSGERHIRGLSTLAWVMVSPDRYVLSTQDGSYVTIESRPTCETSEHVVTFTQRIPAIAGETKTPFRRPREIAMSPTFSDAVHAADTFASQRLPWKFIHGGQAWRKAPATDGQLSFLNKLRPVGDRLTADAISKGKAADMITKVKFGAKGWFGKVEADKKRHEREVGKQQQQDRLRQRENVRVGPLQEA